MAAQIENGETLFLGQGSILRKVIPFLANREELCLLLNDLGHVALAQEFLNGETVLLGGVLSGQGRIVEGELALKALGHYRPSRALIAVDHIAEDGTLSVRNEVTAHLLSEAVAQSKRVIAIVASRPVYGEKRYAVGELQQISSVVTPQVVAAEYHACFLAAGLTNSYTNNECLTWLNTALHKTNRGAVMNVTICTIGELLVEFLAKEENQGFSRPGEFWGPIPAGRRQYLPIRWQSWVSAPCCLAVWATTHLAR